MWNFSLTNIINLGHHWNNHINSYPNPVNSLVTSEFNKKLAEDALIQLFDIDDKLIITKKVEGEKQTLDMTDIHSGLYILKISDSNKNIIKRIVKQ